MFYLLRDFFFVRSQNFGFIKNKLAKASPSLMDATIAFSIANFCTIEQANEVELFFQENPLSSSARRIQQLLENMRTNGLLLNKLLSSSLVTPAYWAESI